MENCLLSNFKKGKLNSFILWLLTNYENKVQLSILLQGVRAKHSICGRIDIAI